MYDSDIKIFELIILLKELGKIKFDKDFCEIIDIQKQNLAPIKKGLAHFTAKHIENICKIYEVNANWIFGIENNVFNQVKPSSIKK
jgi:DNA-binding Xre family transcriptional regulator